MEKSNRKKHLYWLILCSVISFVFIFPLYYTFVNSLRSIYAMPIIALPEKINWINYKYAVTLIPFLRYMASSFVIVGISLAFGMSVDFIYGYAFARLKARGKGVLFTILLAQMMIPSFALQIPQYITFSNLGLKNSYLIWVLTGAAGSPFIIFMYKQYIEAIPKELEEAAYIDGCGVARIIVNIYMPICKSVLAVGFFRIFINQWGNYMTPFMFLSEKKYPLAIALFNSSYTLSEDPSTQLEPVKLAAALLFAIPSMIVFFMCQKQLVSGVTAGSVKG